jgi:hypothetical protein
MLLLLSFFNFSWAQRSKPCPEMDSIMAIIKEGPSELAALYDKQVLFDCGDFDNVDRILLFGDFLDNFMAAYIKKNDSLTYTLMLNELKEVQASPTYRESYEISKTRIIVLNSIADTVLFNQNSPTFNDFFPTSEERNDVRTYIGKHQNDTLTFIEILEQYSSIDHVLVNDQAPPTQQKNQVQFFAFYDLKTALENGAYFERPILLYFSSYVDTISRKMEAEWFYESTINAIMNHMTVYQIMRDESMPMDPSDINYFKKKYKKSFKTYGEKNAYIQQKEFNENNPPFFVLYSATGKSLGTWTYNGEKSTFELFLHLSEQQE